MTKRLFRTALAPGRQSDIPSQPAWSHSRWIVVPYHQPGRLRFQASSRFTLEVSQEFSEVRRRGMSASPRGTEFAPPGTVPIPILRFGITASRFRSRVFSLAWDHIFQLEPAKPLG